MERLTVRIKNRVGVIWATPPETTIDAALARLAAYEDTGLEPEEIREAYHKGWKSALEEIAYAEQAGTVLAEIPLLEEYIKL